MPSKSKKQHNLMAAVANNPAFAKKVGIPKTVGEEFMKADKTKKFKEGGKADMAQDKAMIKKAFKQHDMQEHKGGKGTKLALKKGGMTKGCGYASGGKVAQLSKANGVATKGKTKGTMVAMRSGGKTKSKMC
tara:strand:- start:1065 stop:1460 length:396 start_codon:yes stop_codon:yes gene_type:complete